MDRIKDFPQDGGLWWVRWVDNVQIPAGGTGSPSISVMLCRLDDGTSLDRPPEIAIEGERSDVLQRVCRVLVGMIPGLTIGTVFRNGWRVGRLDAP